MAITWMAPRGYQIQSEAFGSRRWYIQSLRTTECLRKGLVSSDDNQVRPQVEGV